MDPRTADAVPGRPGRSAGTWLTAATLAAAIFATLALLGGCATPGDAAPYRQVLAPSAQPIGDAEAAGPTSRGWPSFGDATLASLVDQALAGNPSLQTAQSRVLQAQAAADMAGAARAPQVNASADLSDQRFTRNGMVPAALAGAVRWNNNAQIGASWELDLFGRQRALLDAAIGQVRATRADAQAARVLLASNVASAYVDLARRVEARRLAQQALVQRDRVSLLVRQRIDAGLDTTVEKHQAEGVIAQSQVEIEALDEAIVRARHALAELVGRAPDAFVSLSPVLADLRTPSLPSALPADLLGRRADLAAQRWRIEAALNEVDVARAQFYPNLNLVAFVGLSSIGLDRFVQAGSQTDGVGPALRLPIFDGGRLRAQLGARRAEVDAAIDAYNGTLLRALREVADELASLQSLQRQNRAQAAALQAAESAFDLAVQRYQAGLGNFLVVLSAESNVIAQRRASAELRARELASDIALARALGGGHADAGPAPELATLGRRELH